MATGLLPAAQAYFRSPVRDYFPGQTVAGMNAYEKIGQANAMRASDDIGGYGYRGAGRFEDYLNQGPQMNPFQSQVMDDYARRMNEQFAEQTMPSLRGSQVADHAAGSSAAGIAQGLAAAKMGDTVSRGLGQLGMQGWQDTQNRYLSALGQAPGQFSQFGSMMQQPGVTRQQIGANYRNLQQQRLGGEMDRWNWYRDAPARRLANYAGAINPATGFSQSTTNQQSQASGSSSPNPWQIAGGLGMIAPHLGGLFGGGGQTGGWGGPGQATTNSGLMVNFPGF